MKKIFWALVFSFLAGLSYSQDTLVYKSGKILTVKVTEVAPEIIKYYLPGQTDSASNFISRDSLTAIKFANGKIDSLENKNYQHSVNEIVCDPKQMYLQGRNDADIYYKAGSAFWGTIAATSPFSAYIVPSIYAIPVSGVISINIFSAIPPQKITVPDQRLLNNPDYMRGYMREARGKRLGNALAGFGLGIAFDFVLFALAFQSISH